MASSVGYKNVSYDDRDTTDLHYTSNWFLTGSWNASHVGETGTLSSSKAWNANVTFTFPQPAVAFYYYGIRRCCGGYYAICVDCDPNNPIFTPIDALNTSDDGENPPVVLYSITFDQPGIHEIILTNQNDTRFPGGNSQITLDRFDLQVVDNNNPTITVTSTASSIGSPAAQTNTATPTALATNATPTGAIVGGVIGGIILLVFVFLLIAWMRRKSRNAHQKEESHPAPLLYAPTVASTSTSQRMLTPDAQSASLPAKYRKQRAAPSSRTATTSASELASGSSSGIRREIDAGRILSDSEDDDLQSQAGTLPPEYEQVFSGESSNRVAYVDIRSGPGQSSGQHQ